MEGAGVIARGFLRWRVVPIVEVDVPAARAEALAYGSAGKARAHHGGLPGAEYVRFFWDSRVACHQHFSLGAKPRACFDGEAGLLQRVPHRLAAAPGGGGGARPGEPRDGATRRGRPHVGVLPRREAVEIDRISGAPPV